MKSLESSNQHLQLCVHFMNMSGDFLEFVNAYCCQDSITIESGYLWFCTTVEDAWAMQVLGSISQAAGLHPPQQSVLASGGGEA